MNKPTILIIFMSFVIMILTTVSRKQHLLPFLLCLESLMLLTMSLMSMTMTYQYMTLASSIIILLLMSASSASIALTLLVTCCRKEGSDSPHMNMLVCQ